MDLFEEALPAQRRSEIVAALLREFVPKREGFHRNAGNEFNYICTTLSRIVLQHFGFRLTPSEVRSALLAAGYQLFCKGGVWSAEQERLVPLRRPTLFHPDAHAKDFCPTRCHVAADGHCVRALRLTTIPLPRNTAAQKRAQLSQLTARLHTFSARLQSAHTER